METFEELFGNIEGAGDAYATAKSNRVHIEQFRKSKKALLMQEAFEQDMNGVQAEAYAYAHPEYVKLLDGLKEAVRVEAEHWWVLKGREMKFEYWRTQQANQRRLQDKV